MEVIRKPERAAWAEFALALCATLAAAVPLSAQERVNSSVGVAEEISRKTGRPILAIAGSAT